MPTVIHKHKLKALLKSMIEQMHYEAVATHVIANKIGAETHNPIEDINASFDAMHEQLDEAMPDTAVDGDGFGG